MASLLLKGIYKVYPSGVTAVTDFNLDIKDKEFIVFVGPSGCGKSTTLRMIAGLEEISKGELYIDGKLVNDVVPKDRDIAMVFQNYALYPHMSVYDNMAFGLKLRKVPKQIIDERVKEAAAILGISDYLTRKPKALSRRSAPACRARPCDRPRAEGVPPRRTSVQPRREAARPDEDGDLQTARTPRDHVHLRHARPDRGDDDGYAHRRHEGRVHAAGRYPAEPVRLPDQPVRRGLYRHAADELLPRNAHQAERRVYVEFVNNKILLPKSVEVRIQNIDDYLDTGKAVTLGVRPEDIHDEENFISASPDTVIKAFVEVVEKLGAETQIYCKLDFKEGEQIEDATDVIGGSSNMVAKIDSRSNVGRGEVVELAIDARHIHIFDSETEMSLLARDEGYEITPENEGVLRIRAADPRRRCARSSRRTESSPRKRRRRCAVRRAQRRAKSALPPRKSPRRRLRRPKRSPQKSPQRKRQTSLRLLPQRKSPSRRLPQRKRPPQRRSLQKRLLPLKRRPQKRRPQRRLLPARGSNPKETTERGCRD